MNAIQQLQMDRGTIVNSMGAQFGRINDCSVLFANELLYRYNAHDKLVSALRAVCGAYDNQDGVPPWVTEARNALAKIEGNAP